ncbi:MAG: biotin synthase BioB [Nitrospirae bacterium]|nr:biotin synthase BioB [Nitrospirota bacterium]
MRDVIREYEERVIAGERLTHDEGCRLAAIPAGSPDLLDLIASANRVRLHYKGAKVDTCAIVNAKSGACSEDCAFCAQSAHHGTEAAVYPLMDGAAIGQAADAAYAAGAEAFGIVAAWKGLREGREFDTLLERIRELARKGKGHVDGSLGHVPTVEMATRLREAGIRTYNHNLETAPSHFPNICSTHTFQDRLDTIGRLKAAGIRICSGAIFGMGETPAQRVELAIHLRDVGTDVLPMNFLNPIPGTPLEHATPLSPQECLQTIALYRLMIPEANLMLAGGREVNLRDMQSWAFHAGANAVMVGNYLTTPGRGPADDFRMIADLGLIPGNGHCEPAPAPAPNPLRMVAAGA